MSKSKTNNLFFSTLDKVAFNIAYPEGNFYEVRFLLKIDKRYGEVDFDKLEDAKQFVDFLKKNGYSSSEYEITKTHILRNTDHGVRFSFDAPHNHPKKGYSYAEYDRRESNPGSSSSSNKDKWLIPSRGIAGIIMSNVARDNDIPYEMV